MEDLVNIILLVTDDYGCCDVVVLSVFIIEVIIYSMHIL